MFVCVSIRLCRLIVGNMTSYCQKFCFNFTLAVPCKDNLDCFTGNSTICVSGFCQESFCRSRAQCVHGQACSESGKCTCKKSSYRSQRSWGKVIFSQASVILFTGGVCLSACWDTTPGTRHPPWHQASLDQAPPWDQAPQDQAPPWDQAPPQTRHPPGPGTSWDQAPPWTRHPLGPVSPPPPGSGTPPTWCRACWEIRSTRGQYTSYLNAILSVLSFGKGKKAVLCIGVGFLRITKYLLKIMGREIVNANLALGPPNHKYIET